MSEQANASTGDFETAEQGVPTTSLFCAFPAVEVEFAARSHTGRVRTNNEDHYFVGRWGRFMDAAATNLPEGDLPARAEEVGYSMIVADGMGGEEGGEVASRLAIRTLIKQAMQMPEWLVKVDPGASSNIVERTRERYQAVDDVLRRHAARDQKLSRMGTTMTMAYSVGADLFVAHIGDSRAYLCRNGELRQLTRDQTVAQLLVERGEMSPEQAATHRLRHVLTQVLGGQGEELKVDAQRIVLQDGDWVLLCSDGLTDMVSDGEIGDLLNVATTADGACQSLIERALESGGRDNVTAVVARYRFPSAA